MENLTEMNNAPLAGEKGTWKYLANKTQCVQVNGAGSTVLH